MYKHEVEAMNKEINCRTVKSDRGLSDIHRYVYNIKTGINHTFHVIDQQQQQKSNNLRN